MRTSDSLAKISPDLVAAIGALKGAAKVAENGAFKQSGKPPTKYATLESCVEATRDVLAEHNLCVIQAPGEVRDKVLVVTTRVLHSSGEWIESDFHMPLTKWSPHEAGSATTYARRYALMAALNLAPIEDDDGNAASGVGADRLSPEQVKIIDGLIASTATPPDLILKYAKVNAISEIPASEFTTIKAKLEARQPQQKKAA